MGYLAVMCGSFLVSLIGSAVALAVLSNLFFGSVQEWVLGGAVILSFVATMMACHWYEDTHNPWKFPR
jgi:membrane protein implicated in regulation of membrane protease activity